MLTVAYNVFAKTGLPLVEVDLAAQFEFLFVEILNFFYDVVVLYSHTSPPINPMLIN